MTERLYYTDSYLRDFTARIIGRSDGDLVYLDRTAFYPTSGGQPFDTGSIAGVRVLEVIDEEDRIAHRVAGPLPVEAVDCSIDWSRRFDHMQQHSGQHLISAVFEELLSMRTVSFHLGADSSTIDIEGPSAVDARALQEVERRANEIVYENRPVTVQFESAADAQGLRKPSDREGTLRIVSIDGLDRSACGGTHVRATGDIGVVLLRKTEKIRQSTRVEFVCGARAVRRARADYEALSRTAQLFSSALDDTPVAAAAQLEAARAAEKARSKLVLDLAGYRGRELYQQTAPGPDGVRRSAQSFDQGSLEELRAVAQNFTAQGKALFLAVLKNPPSLLLATAADSNVDAGQIVKSAVTAAGGRGGGNARMAQGSVPSPEALQSVVQQIATAHDLLLRNS